MEGDILRVLGENRERKPDPEKAGWTESSEKRKRWKSRQREKG